MTREEAYRLAMRACDITWNEKTCEQIREALEQQPCEDAVSRQAVLDTLDKMDKALDTDRTVENYKELLTECYKDLPPVIPKKKTGRWIGDKCSKCGNERAWYGNNPLFCPDCGAKMVEPQESEDKEVEHETDN